MKPYLYEMPDVFYAPLTSEQYDEIAASLPEEIEKNYQLYVESLSKLCRFLLVFLLQREINENKLG